jgi:trk system potassium uptake protein
MRVLIVGCGRVGSSLARELDAAGHQVTIIDERVAAFSRLGEDFKGEAMVGTGIDESVLRRAGIESADCFASVTNGDNRNIMAAQIAKVVFKVPRVITRIYDPIREEVYREMGLETVCSTRIISDIMRGYLVEGVNRAHPTPAGEAAVAAGRSG